MANARQAPAQRPRKLARAHLTVLQQQLDDGEGNGVSEHAAQTRLPVALFFHADPFITFLEFLKPRPLSRPMLPSCAIAQLGNMLCAGWCDNLKSKISRAGQRAVRDLFIACGPDTLALRKVGFRSRRRANGPNKSTALFPFCKFRRTINGR